MGRRDRGTLVLAFTLKAVCRAILRRTVRLTPRAATGLAAAHRSWRSKSEPDFNAGAGVAMRPNSSTSRLRRLNRNCKWLKHLVKRVRLRIGRLGYAAFWPASRAHWLHCARAGPGGVSRLETWLASRPAGGPYSPGRWSLIHRRSRLLGGNGAADDVPRGVGELSRRTVPGHFGLWAVNFQSQLVDKVSAPQASRSGMLRSNQPRTDRIRAARR